MSEERAAKLEEAVKRLTKVCCSLAHLAFHHGGASLIDVTALIREVEAIAAEFKQTGEQ